MGCRGSDEIRSQKSEYVAVSNEKTRRKLKGSRRKEEIIAISLQLSAKKKQEKGERRYQYGLEKNTRKPDLHCIEHVKSCEQ